MVEATIDDNSRTGQIVLRPNLSWTWQYNLYLLYTLTTLSLMIGIGFMVVGAWVILPYSVLELSVLFACMYYCIKKCERQEVITVTDYLVKIERGTRTPSESWQYQRLWSNFMVQKPRHPWDPALVAIRSHGKELELGNFLSRGDKQELIRQLKRVVPNPSQGF